MCEERMKTTNKKKNCTPTIIGQPKQGFIALKTPTIADGMIVEMKSIQFLRNIICKLCNRLFVKQIWRISISFHLSIITSINDVRIHLSRSNLSIYNKQIAIWFHHFYTSYNLFCVNNNFNQSAIAITGYHVNLIWFSIHINNNMGLWQKCLRKWFKMKYNSRNLSKWIKQPSNWPKRMYEWDKEREHRRNSELKI